MTIQPLGNNIQIEIEEAKAGVLDTSSRDSAIEYAKVVAISNMAKVITGEPDKDIKTGDYVFVKAWAVDIISHEGKKYYFCNLETNGVLAVIK